MLDDHHGVALVAEPFQNRDEPLGVFWVEPDAGLVQHVGAADKRTAHTRAQGDALGFATAQGGAAAHEGQVPQAQIHQAGQPVLHLPQKPLRDGVLCLRQRQAVLPRQGLLHRHAQDVVDGDAAHEHMSCVRPDARAMARGAFGSAAVPADHHAVLNLVALRFQHVEEGVDALEMGASVPNQLPLGVGQLLPRRVHRKVHGTGGHDQPLAPTSRALAAPRGHRTIVQASGRVRHHLVGVDAQHVSVAFACSARPDRAVEVEHVWGGLREDHAVPFEAVVEFHGLGFAVL